MQESNWSQPGVSNYADVSQAYFPVQVWERLRIFILPNPPNSYNPFVCAMIVAVIGIDENSLSIRAPLRCRSRDARVCVLMQAWALQIDEVKSFFLIIHDYCNESRLIF